MLSKTQSDWIQKRLKDFLDRNLPLMPFRDEDWNRTRKEAVALEKLVRKDPDCVKRIVQTLFYLEKIDELCRVQTDDGISGGLTDDGRTLRGT